MSSIFFPSPSPSSPDDLIRIDTKVRCNFEGKMLAEGSVEIRECTIMGRMGGMTIIVEAWISLAVTKPITGVQVAFMGS